MRCFRVYLAAAVILLSTAAAAQTVTITEETVGSIQKVVVAWTSDAAGDATGSTSGVFNGRVLAVVTDPDGTDAPTALYDVTMTDEDSVDVLNGTGADRSATAIEQVTDEASLGVVANDALTFTVSNAGNAKKGKLYLYIR